MPKASRTPASASVKSSARPAAKASRPSAKQAAAETARPVQKKGSAKRTGPAAPKISAKDAARAATQPGAGVAIDGDVDVTPVRIIDDRRFTGKYQVIEDEGDRRVLGWGFDSILSAKRWVENRNKLSSWLQLMVRGG